MSRELLERCLSLLQKSDAMLNADYILIVDEIRAELSKPLRNEAIKNEPLSDGIKSALQKLNDKSYEELAFYRKVCAEEKKNKSKHSQSEELNLAEYWKREHDELKSKLAEAEKDVERYQWLYDRPANIPGPQCFMVDEHGRPYYPVKGNDLTILIDQHFDIAEPQTTFNNTKELG